MNQKLFVVFSTSGPEIKGDVSGGLAPGAPRKIVFVEGYNPKFPAGYRGFLPAGGEEWLCELVRDTRPGQRTGAYIAAPMRPTRWEWRQVGDAVLGEREWRPTCVHDPARPPGESPFSAAEQAEKNAPYARACARKRALEDPFASEKGFWALAEALGAPRAAETDGDSILFRYDGATARARPETLAALGWPCELAGPCTLVGRAFTAHLALSAWPALRFSGVAAEIVGGDLLPREPTWGLIGGKGRRDILARARAANTPEVAAERDLAALLASQPGLLEDLAQDLVDIQRPGTCYLTPSPGKPGWSKLWTGGRWAPGSGDLGSGILCCEVQGSWACAEDCRHTVLDARRREALAALVGPPTSAVPIFYGAPEWEDRYARARHALAEAAVNRAEMEASIPLAKLQAAEEQYEKAADEARRLQADIDAFWLEAQAAGASRWELPSEVRIAAGTSQVSIRDGLEPARQWLRAARTALASYRAAPAQVRQTGSAAAGLGDLQKKFNRRK